MDWVTGACFLARADVFAAAGGFDPAFFLHYEDVDLARRLALRGQRTLYDPSLSVMHVRPHHGRPPQPSIEACVRASRRAYFRRHRPAWENALMSVLTRLELLVRRRSRVAPVAPLPAPSWVVPGVQTGVRPTLVPLSGDGDGQAAVIPSIPSVAVLARSEAS